MFVKYAIGYLQSQIQLGEAPDVQGRVKPKPEDIEQFRKTIAGLQRLEPQAPLSQIFPILRQDLPERLAESPYYTSFIQPLEEELQTFQREQQERISKATEEREQRQRIRQEDLSASKDYLEELNKLRAKLHEKVQPKLDQLLKGLRTFTDDQAEEHDKILENTYNLLTDNMSAKEYQDFAKTVQGKPSPVLKAIGALMIALAAAVVAFAFAVPTAGLSLEVAAYSAAALAGPGAFSIFAGRQKGVSRDMEELAHTQVAQLK